MIFCFKGVMALKIKSDDRRIRKTRAAIENAFLELLKEEDIKKITITEITKKADTNRSTFYLHYYDVYDLLDCVENKIINEIHDCILEAEQLKEKLDVKPVLEYIKDNQKIFKALLKSDSNFRFFNKLSDMFEKKLFCELFDVKSLDEKKYKRLSCFLIGGVVSLIRDWLATDMEDCTPAHLAETIENITLACISGVRIE